jgi:hypothetical protein
LKGSKTIERPSAIRNGASFFTGGGIKRTFQVPLYVAGAPRYLMKKNLPSEGNDRFSGNLQHYHRTRTQAKRSWDDWVDGDAAKSRRSWNWAKILWITLGVVSLGGIIVGLVIELG